jgi:predicted dithiol-disulfide oxidoreductase (DUF899 family)
MPTQTKRPRPDVVSQEEWLAKRKELLTKEKEFTHHGDRVDAERRRLPMVKIVKGYSFEGSDGTKTLKDLFEGQTQLIVYHFMYGPDDKTGCPGCTGYVNALGDLSMLPERNTNFVLVSRGHLPKLLDYKEKNGWTCPWYSSFESDFNYDYHVTLDESKTPIEYNYRTKEELITNGSHNAPEGEEHGLSVFFRDGDEVFHTYSCYARGTESLTDSYQLLDVTPYGRQEDWEDSPPGWPQKPTYG